MSLHIESQPLPQALDALASQTGVQLVYHAEDIRPGVVAPAVQGSFTPDNALTKILDSSGLSFYHVNSKTIAIRMAQEGGAPPDNTSRRSSTTAEKVSVGEASASKKGEPGGTSTESETRAPLSEVIVSAQKRDERLIDVPQAVTVLSADALAQSGATQFRDFAASIPGLSYHTSGPGINQISLRGVTVGSDVSATVGVYVDDVPYGSSTSFTKAGIVTLDSGLFDLDRIEVLKGPQGTLYGSSTMGGLIKYVTRQPDATSFGGAIQSGVSGTEHGSVNYNFAAELNAPIIEGKAAARVSGFENHDGGYIDNVKLGSNNVNSSDIYGGRIDLLLMPTDRLSVRVGGFAQNITTDGFPLADYTLAGSPVYGSLDQSRSFPESFDLDFRLASATVKYDLDRVSLTSISSYQTIRSDIFADYSAVLLKTAQSLGAPVNAVGFSDHQATDKFTQEVRFASQGHSVLEWVLGGFYTHESSDNNQAFVLQGVSGQTLPNTLFTFFVPSVYKEYAGFGDLTWHLTHTLDVTGGLRYAKNSQTFSQTGTGALGHSAPTTDFTGSTTTYLADARYHFSDSSTGYVRYATGYRPGGPNFVVLNQATGLPIGPPTFGADTLKSYEVGFKAQTEDGRFGIDVDAFYIDWRNIQLTVTVGGLSARANAPDGASVRGAELTLTARPISALTLTGAFAYQDPKLKSAVPALGATAGERLSDVPPITANVSADYALPWGTRLRPTVGATFHYQDHATNGYGPTAFTLPAFSTLDLHGGVSLDRVDVQLYVHNITDERGRFAPRLVLYPAAGPVQVSLIQPLTVGLQATAKF